MIPPEGYRCPQCSCRLVEERYNFLWRCLNCEFSVSSLAIVESKGLVLEVIGKKLRRMNPWPPRWVGWR